jgi:iron complex transport system ATP-binding protein
MKFLNVSQLDISIGKRKILQDVSFGVNAGEIFSIIGPNGSGKTTLLKALSSILPVSSGSITLQNNDLSALNRKEIAQKIALVPQQEHSGALFSVEETVLMGRSPHLGLFGYESRRDYEMAYQAMEFTDVADLAKRKMNELSGGERQRVIIARAICQQADLILLDEPTSALDYSHQIQIMDLMEQFRAEKNVTVVLVSHDVNLAAMYSDRMMILKGGSIREIGHPSDVLTEKNMQQYFDCSMHVSENPYKSVPRVMPIPSKFR